MEMAELTLQEKEVVDELKATNAPMPVAVLAKQLQWHSARLHPVLAVLVEKKVIASKVDTEYPHVKRYFLVTPDARPNR